jgi:hypothetical protein
VSSSPDVGAKADALSPHEELQALFHRLNNQLGIVLAHAEVLESKAADASHRSRAAQLVASTLAAMGLVRELRHRTIPSSPQWA